MTGRDQLEKRADEALLEAARNSPGSGPAREAASELFARYRRRVYNWCFRYLRDHERALDMAQEVLMNAYRNLDSFRGDSAFSSWLYSIARNRCFNEQRRPAILYEGDVELDGLVGPQADPAEILARKMDEEAVLDLVRDHLEPQEQEVLWLRCFERMPIDAITDVLRIDQASGARGILQRARRRLRAALAQQEIQGAEGES
jgi:RNA polymerase sigma-70 factor (ECF subfamily)